MFENITRDFLMLWATIDPIGTLALFAALTTGATDHERKRIALKAITYSAIILVSSIIIGQIILSTMGIKLISLQLAGGIILFLFSLKMIFENLSFDSSGNTSEEGHDLAVFPLAVPSIASPGAIIAVILLTDNNIHPWLAQAATAIVLLAVLVITYLLMLSSGAIIKSIGKNGAAILVRVMGMILAALSVEFVMTALGAERWLAGI